MSGFLPTLSVVTLEPVAIVEPRRSYATRPDDRPLATILIAALALFQLGYCLLQAASRVTDWAPPSLGADGGAMAIPLFCRYRCALIVALGAGLLLLAVPGARLWLRPRQLFVLLLVVDLTTALIALLAP